MGPQGLGTLFRPVSVMPQSFVLADRLAGAIEQFEGVRVPVGAIDSTLYRDDLQMISQVPIVGETAIKDDITGRVIILVDDVLFSGRTIRAALDETNRRRQLQTDHNTTHGITPRTIVKAIRELEAEGEIVMVREEAEAEGEEKEGATPEDEKIF